MYIEYMNDLFCKTDQIRRKFMSLILIDHYLSFTFFKDIFCQLFLSLTSNNNTVFTLIYEIKCYCLIHDLLRPFITLLQSCFVRDINLK